MAAQLDATSQSGPQRETGDGRLDAGDRPERLERRRQQRRVVRAAAVGWYRKDFRFPSNSGSLSWVVRFESVNYRSQVWLNGRPHRHATAAPTCRSSSACRQGPQRAAASTASSIRVDNRRLPTDFPPAGLSVDRRADRRLVELRRPAARGLPAAGRRHRLQHASSSSPNLPCAHVRGDDPLPGHGAQLRREGAQRVTVTRHASAASGVDLGTKSVGAAALRDVHARRVRDRATRACGRPTARRSTTPRSRASSGGADAPALHAAHRHPLDQGRRRAPVPQRPAAELPRRRRCTRTTRRRASRSTTRTATRSSRWVKELGATMIRATTRCTRTSQELADELGIMLWSEIPVYSVKSEVPQAEARPPARGTRARVQHRDQRQPPVGHRLVDRQRAQRAARPGPGRLHRSAPRKAAKALDPTRPVGLAVAGYPSRRLPAARTRRSTSSASTTTSAGTRAPTARSPTARCSPTTSTRSAPATRTRRSSSPSSAPRPTATARSRRRARTPSSRTS